MAHADVVPLLGDLRTSAVTGRATRSGECRLVCAEPIEALVPTTLREECRLPGDQDAFHRYAREGMMSRRDCSLRPSRPALSLTPPTRFPQAGESAFVGALQASRCGHPECVMWIREDERLFCSVDFRAWDLTTQARHRGRSTRPSTRTDCLARTGADRSA